MLKTKRMNFSASSFPSEILAVLPGERLQLG